MENVIVKGNGEFLPQSISVEPEVILVDEFDNVIGHISEAVAHKQQMLHRGFSVFIFNDQEQLLMCTQPSAWANKIEVLSNTYCGHPPPRQSTKSAAYQLLERRIGLAVDLASAGAFTYYTRTENGHMDCEYNHVFYGYLCGSPEPMCGGKQYEWVSLEELREQIQ